MSTGGFGARAVFACLAVIACCVLRTAYADDADPPGRVARLSDAEGAVSLLPAGAPDWTPADLNRPLTSGDKLWSDQGSRAELDLGAAAIRLGAMTGFSFLNLDDRSAQMQLTAGTLIVHVRDLHPNDLYEIDTPNLALTLHQPGEYRVEVDDSGDLTVVKVIEGEAFAAGGGVTVGVSTQQIVTFSGTQTLSYAASTLGAPDDLDAWSAQREQRVEDSASRAYMADEVPGTQDLDQNGTWQNTPEYGYVWAPSVIVAGWAPYRLGHWVWIAPWGWTWVDDAPWGFAPFHYGRWVMWNGAWCWVPGPRHVQPLYAPATVGWVSKPAQGGPAPLAASVGWFPLAPHEVYWPAYPVSSSYLRRLNLTNIYQNQLTNTHYLHNTPAAVTLVPESVFISAQRVGGHALHVSASTLAGATVTAAAPPIKPSLESLLGSTSQRRVARPPPTLVNRSVVARTQPPPPPPSFAQQQTAIAAHGGRPLNRAELAHLEPAAAPLVRVVPAGAFVAAKSPPRAGRSTQAQLSLAERAHLLQTTQMTSAPRIYGASQTPLSASAAASTPTPPASPLRTDRPSWSQQQVSSVVERTFSIPEPAQPVAAVRESPAAVAPSAPKPTAPKVETRAPPAAAVPSHASTHPASKPPSASHSAPAPAPSH